MASLHQRIFLAVLTLLTAGSAAAAQITLYESPDFHGRSVTLRGPTANLDGTFNDRTSSIVIRSGTWQVCTDADFGGSCRQFGPGQYPRLDRVLTESISSARPVEHAPPPRPGPGGGPVSVQLFEQRNYGGRSMTLTDNAANFDPLGFNDRADAAIVRGGVWRLCSDAYMRGKCRDFPPGRYSDLGSLGGKVSSASIVRR